MSGSLIVSASGRSYRWDGRFYIFNAAGFALRDGRGVLLHGRTEPEARVSVDRWEHMKNQHELKRRTRTGTPKMTAAASERAARNAGHGAKGKANKRAIVARRLADKPPKVTRSA